MGRPKKTNTDGLLDILEQYFEEEASGDPELLKCSLLEKYAAKRGFCVKAYDFRRDEMVRNRLEELKEAAGQEAAGRTAIAYKNLDVDGLIRTCSDLQELKNSLIEVDGYWKSVYDVAAELKVQNTQLFTEKIRLESEIRTYAAGKSEADEQLAAAGKTINSQQREIRSLKQLLSTHLYPALANELLRQANLPAKENTSVRPAAFETLIDGKIPAPFEGIQDQKPPAMTRQEKLLEQMKAQVRKDGN